MKYFGTDGIRGKVDGACINEEFYTLLGIAVGQWLRQQFPKKPLVAAVGRDTRASGERLSRAVIKGMCHADIHSYDIGVAPTPAVASAVLRKSAHLGVVITASHNPVSDNGIKFFNAEGFKLTQAEEAAIEEILDGISPEQALERVATCEKCKHKQCSHPTQDCGRYTNHMQSLLNKNCLEGWKIGLDTANGATASVSPAVLKHFGASLTCIADKPDGTNINLNVGSECPSVLAKVVKEQSLDIGIAHDGDGDRAIFIDEQGEVVDGDQVLGLLALHAQAKKRLDPAILVTTIQSNMGLDKALGDAGITVLRSSVGDRNVLYKMQEHKALLGGENSGHVICADESTTGDGLLTAIRLIQAMFESKKPLSELKKQVTLFPQVTSAIKVQEKKPIETLPTLSTAIADAEASLAGNGRVLVRYSGTEAKIRLLVESNSNETASHWLSVLEDAVSKDLVITPS